MSKTDKNLKKAFAGESKANRKYLAFANQAMKEEKPEIAQLFMEAAGAETTHALSHFKVMDEMGDTEENLKEAAQGEDYEIEEMYPNFIEQAKEEGREEAAKSFRVAMEREKEHRKMFQKALEKFEE
ncbi:MAG: rubrerythrin family protein [Candidatus Paceibacterota bacterium]